MNKQKTVDGLDGVMQVNHLGPFLLTNLLVDVIKESAEGRIVFVTSSGAFFHNMSVDKLQEPDYFFPTLCLWCLHYYNSKLCNMVTSLILAEELRKSNITSNSLHPGMTSTDFLVSNAGNDIFGTFKRNTTLEILKCTTKDVKTASHMQVFVATSATLKNVTGQYFADYVVHRPPSVLEDKGFCTGIWEESKRLVGLS
ncbi:unnamed protein product [Callosobruchus maculatus]|uniref:Uncharacterized protein n=1 Tax=Callosobruchus maculatus TaxID=64391 RepID=A0A653BNV5_CALMS|nr:unnamed protein product [Callosobruchus maculatus]